MKCIKYNFNWKKSKDNYKIMKTLIPLIHLIRCKRTGIMQIQAAKAEEREREKQIGKLGRLKINKICKEKLDYYNLVRLDY